MDETKTEQDNILNDPNLGEIFQLAMINSRPPKREKFNWANFKPQAVKSAEDLPSYLVFGPLNRGTLIISADGFNAEWSDPEQKAKIVLNWNSKTHKYTASQVWDGEEGSATQQDDTTPLIQVFAMLYEDGFPKNWDAKAKEQFEGRYYLTWLEGNERLPTYFAAPDGVFRVISFPVMIKNLRHARTILEHISAETPNYGFFATVTLMQQDVYYKLGTAPDWTRDIAMCMTQSIGETGLIPQDIPRTEEIEGAQWNHLVRDAMMLHVFVPFAGMRDMLQKLSESPMPIIERTDAPIRRDLLPVVSPQGLSEKLNSFTLDDTIQGIRVTYTFLAPEIALDDLLTLDSNSQIDRLEKFSDAILDQLSADVEEAKRRAKEAPRIVTE